MDYYCLGHISDKCHALTSSAPQRVLDCSGTPVEVSADSGFKMPLCNLHIEMNLNLNCTPQIFNIEVYCCHSFRIKRIRIREYTVSTLLLYQVTCELVLTSLISRDHSLGLGLSSGFQSVVTSY